MDGSASAVHLGLTIGGCRTVTFLQEAVQPTVPQAVTQSVASDVIVRCTPGHAYITAATGARHRVTYDDVVCDDDLVRAPSGTLMSFCVMMRSCVFPDMSRLKGGNPTPKHVWNIFCSCVRELISDSRLRLPSDDDIKSAPDDLIAEDHLL